MNAVTQELPNGRSTHRRGVRPDLDVALLLIGIIGGVVFAALMLASAWIYDAVSDADGVSGFDKPVLNWAIGQRTPALSAWVTAFTHLGTTVPMVVMGLALTTILFVIHRRRTIWILMLVAAAGSITFTLMGKPLFGRVRPELQFAVPPYEDSFSFPSGHALNSTVVAGMLAYLVCWLTRRQWVRVGAVLVAVVWSAAMGISRVHLGHHWLTDVMFAWLFGLGWLALLITVHQLLLRRRVRTRPRRAEAVGG